MIKVGDIYEGKISMNASGSAYFINESLKKDIYIHNKYTNRALHLDTVKIKVVDGYQQRGLEGQVIEIISRFKTEFVGVISIKPKFAFFMPDSAKLPIDFFIPMDKLNGALDGQKVVAKITNWKENAKNPNGEIVTILGYAGDNDTEIHSILHEYNLPYNFDENVIAESEAISDVIEDSVIAERRDMREVLTFTIDPINAKDFDDAISVQWIDGNIEVGIHIADVSHYMRPDTDLDKEAYKRGTSIYLVDRVVPMLPERLSNGLCSLRPHEDKLCFSAIFNIDKDAKITNEWFGRTVINSNHRFSYEDAQVIIEGGESDVSNTLKNSILELDKLAKKFRKNRLKNGAMSFDKQEIKFVLDEQHKPIDIVFKTSKDANKLIEEFMLLANRRVAKLINDQKLPMVNRAHDTPSPERLSALKELIKQFDYTINIDTPEHITTSLNKLLEDIKGKPEENMISNLVVRSMQKANYMTKNIGHYGLGFDDYAHFTSPIRRYPDVMVHRILGRFLDNKTTQKLEKIDAKCTYLSEREKVAQKAERDSIKYMQTIYMSDKIGKVFKGLITSVQDYGVFVTIEENGCDCFIRLSNIGSDTFFSDVNNYCVKGFNTGEVIRLGDTVSVVITQVNSEKKTIDASIIRL
jgi:ribonuclease R